MTDWGGRRSYLLALYHGLLGLPELEHLPERRELPGGDVLFTLNGVSERRAAVGSEGRYLVKSLYFLGPEGATAQSGTDSETGWEEEL